MNLALRISEILSIIFLYLDAKSQLTCSLVCKSWSDTALDLLWQELDSPKPLVRLLSPLRQSDEDPHMLDFQRPIRTYDWSIFGRYMGRVKTLVLEYVYGYPHLSPTVYSELAFKRPAMALLPNLIRLEVGPGKSGDLDFPLLFMNENVKELRFRYPFLGAFICLTGESLSEFFRQCAMRMPKLKTFEFCTMSSIVSDASLQAALFDFLVRMKELERFICSIYSATPIIVTWLSTLPALRVITFENKGRFAQAADVLPFRPSISPGAFPSLVELSFCAAFGDASSFIEIDFAPRLTVLRIYSPLLESAESLHHLLLTLSLKRTHLTRLNISSVATGTDEPMRDVNDQELDVVTFRSLSPILQLNNLIEFEITYHRSFQISNADLEKLLENWSALEVLRLCSDPVLKEKPCLTPDILPIIARCCPRLRYLSLYLDAHVTDMSPPSVTPPRTNLFTALVQIDFGLSPLAEDEISDFALYLSRLLPLACQTDPLCNVSWLLAARLAVDGFKPESDLVLRWQKTSGVIRKVREGVQEVWKGMNELPRRRN